jgi:hypothetical protein
MEAIWEQVTGVGVAGGPGWLQDPTLMRSCAE